MRTSSTPICWPSSRHEREGVARSERGLPLLIALQRRLELLAELGELVGAHVADRAELHAALAPGADVEALHHVGPRRNMRGVVGLLHKQIDDMGAALVDDGAD